jgi:hypothetical protein
VNIFTAEAENVGFEDENDGADNKERVAADIYALQRTSRGFSEKKRK